MTKYININSLIALAVAIVPVGLAISARADTVNARCDVYPKGDDRATSSGSCTFSQRQGAVSIQLQNGKRYELSPVGDQPGNYRDQNGEAAYRQAGLGDAGQIYRLATESIFVYWEAAASADLQTYADPAMAIATRYPSNMTVEANCSGEGCGYFFTFKPQSNALDRSQVHIFLPAGARTATQVETGLDDLVRSNGWTVTAAAPPPELMYPWVKRILTFTTDTEMVGQVLIGETNGQGVRVTLFYPAEMSTAFSPAAKAILDNLQFNPDKLPIPTRD